METALAPAVGADDVRAIVQAAGEPQWLAAWRHDAWDAYAAAPLPDRVVHLWRYTDPAKFLPDRVTPILPAESPAPESEIPAGVQETAAGMAIVEDGVLQTCYLEPRWRDAGVVLTGLASAALQYPELVQEHLGNVVGAEAGKFEALNAALFAGGLFLFIPGDLHIEQPFLLFRRGSVDRSALFPRLLLLVESGTEATVIDEYSSPGDLRLLAHAVVEGKVLDNARLSYFNVQRWGERTRSHAHQHFDLMRDASVTTVNIGLGGRYNKAHLTNMLRGHNAQSEMIGVIFGNHKQHFDNHTEHIHAVGNTYSDMDFKVVLEDRARSAYTGLIRIELEARNSEAYQENRNLMLDPECRAESIPELEILNQDVRCTHGATVGPIDEEQVYYLQTRGLGRRDAERLIVEGFFGPALDRIQEDSLRHRLWDYVDSKIKGRT